MNTTTQPPALRRIDDLLSHYGSSHQHPVNEAIHLIAIPLIMLSLLGLLSALHPWVAYAFVGASVVYYVRLGSPLMLLGMGLWTVGLLALVQRMGDAVVGMSVAIFIGAWILQFVGHKLEGKKPSFFEDIQYLWVGPLFVLAVLYRKLGLRF
jgi:uncharacterized membrane protein YGL010W